MISRLKTPEEGERKSKKREYREWSRNTNKHNPPKAHPRRTHTHRKKTHPLSWARKGYSADPSLIITDPSYSGDPSHFVDPFLIVTDPVNDLPLSQSDRHEQPNPEPICPSCEQPTPRSDHPVSDSLLDRAATFRSTHRVHVATTVATIKSPMNRSLSLCHWSPSLTIGLGILIFLFWLLFLWLFIYFDSL